MGKPLILQSTLNEQIWENFLFDLFLMNNFSTLLIKFSVCYSTANNGKDRTQKYIITVLFFRLLRSHGYF